MRINEIKSSSPNFAKNKCDASAKASDKTQNMKHLPNGSYSSKNVQAKYAPFLSKTNSKMSFKGNASNIKNAYIITGEEDDLPLLVSRENGSYVIDFDSQTEVIYGNNAKKFLSQTNTFKYDTQIIIPKNTEAVLITDDNKEISLNPNTACLINAGTTAKVLVKNGYPMVLMSKKDYDWYERYGKDAESQSIQQKYRELVYYNSHLYNGEFSPNSLLSSKLTDDSYLKTFGIEKWQEQNNLLNTLYSRRECLPVDERQEVEFVKNLVDKLLGENLAVVNEKGYLKFRHLYNINYQTNLLKEKGFSDEEIDTLMPVYKRVRQTKMDTIIALKNSADLYSPELIEKMKEKGFLHNAKKHDGNVYWKDIYGSEEDLRNALIGAGFSFEEQESIIRGWRQENKSGFDITGLKFINNDLAVYNLNHKLNNWTHEETNWVTNSTTMKSGDGSSPFVGVSLVQLDKKCVASMSKIRKEEKLHCHPNLGEKRQTEVYIVTSGAAALNVVKNGKSKIQILKEGDLAVVGPGVIHSVNSILGEYEHIVTQVPSAFQYGFDFKKIVEPPEDFNQEDFTIKAEEELENYEQNK